MKLFNVSTITLSLIGGVIGNLLGGYDGLMLSLCIVMIVDYITGLLKAFKQKKINSNVGFWGIVNKLIRLLIIVAVVAVQSALKIGVPFREIILTFFIVNEFISILENASTFVNGLEWIIDYFEVTNEKIMDGLKQSFTKKTG